MQLVSVKFERTQVLGTPANVRCTVAAAVTSTTCKCCPHLLSLAQLDPLSESSLNVTLSFRFDVRYAVSLGVELELPLKCDGTSAETRLRLSLKRTSPFKSAGASVQSTAGSRGVRISVSNAGYTTFRVSVRMLTTHSIHQFLLHSPTRASPCAIRFQTHSTDGSKDSSALECWTPKTKAPRPFRRSATANSKEQHAHISRLGSSSTAL